MLFVGLWKPSASALREVCNPGERIEAPSGLPRGLLMIAPYRSWSAVMTNGRKENTESNLVVAPPIELIRGQALKQAASLEVIVRKQREDFFHVTVCQGWSGGERFVLKANVELADIVERSKRRKASDLFRREIVQAAKACQSSSKQGPLQQRLAACGNVCTVVGKGVPFDGVAVLCLPEFAPKVCGSAPHAQSLLSIGSSLWRNHIHTSDGVLHTTNGARSSRALPHRALAVWS